MNKQLINWLIFISLSVIWGSSFILMKLGLSNGLNAYQVASIRIVSAGIVLLPVALRSFSQIPRDKLMLVFLSGVLGSLFPAYLFCIAETGIDSSLAGTLNALTPIFAVITGALFFKRITPLNKVAGIIIAFTGSILLLVSKGHMQESRHLLYVSFVILATFMYGFNINMVAKYLLNIPSIQIAAVGLVFSAVPALLVLMVTGFFALPLTQPALIKAYTAATVLGIGGTAIATVLFYMLVKRAGAVFASMVTYGIPFVAIGWGLVYQESLSLLQCGCLLIILSGVYLTNKKPSAVAPEPAAKTADG